MKYIFTILAAFGLSACAGVTFHEEVPGTAEAEATQKETGLPFYQSKPYLLVTRSNAKDGGVESKIVYLPDLTTRYFARYIPGLGSSKFTLSLADGRLSSFNQEMDSKIPELLANLASPVKGLGEAAASFATADLTGAQEDALRAALASSGGDSKLESASGIMGTFVRQNQDVCGARPPSPLPAHNPQLSTDQARQLVIAIIDLGCAIQRFAGDVSQTKRASVEAALRSLIAIYGQNFLQSEVALTLVVLEKHPTAAPLRAVVGPLKEFDISPGDKPSSIEQDIEARVRNAANAALAVADQLDPPKSPAPKEPFDLYEIKIAKDGTTLKKVEMSKVEPPPK